jgi:hypothetical protein
MENTRRVQAAGRHQKMKMRMEIIRYDIIRGRSI